MKETFLKVGLYLCRQKMFAFIPGYTFNVEIHLEPPPPKKKTLLLYSYLSFS